jgi:low affinity Fe/Cu permease
MSDISLVDTDQIAEKVDKILRQTDYTEEIAIEKLKENNFDELKVIMSYFGISEKVNKPIKTLNQEIYKQIRYRLDSNMREYQDRIDKGLAKKIN